MIQEIQPMFDAHQLIRQGISPTKKDKPEADTKGVALSLVLLKDSLTDP